MAIVIEVVNRSGHVIHCSVFDKTIVSIGRAYENDFIVADDYVDPRHAEIQLGQGSDEFLCTDKNSTNGFFLNKKHKKTGEALFPGGSLLIIGKTMLRVSSSETKISPAIPISFWENAGDFLAQWWVVLLFSMALSTLLIMDAHISNPLIDDRSGKYVEVFYFFGAIALLSGLFAFLGKVFRHDSRFWLYFCLIVSFLLLMELYDWLIPIIFFNLGWVQINDWLDNIFYSACIGLLLFLAFRFSVHIKILPRLIASSIIPVLVLLNLIIQSTKDEDETKFYPPYDKLVYSYSLYWGKAEDQQNFIMATQSLYSVDKHIDGKL